MEGDSTAACDKAYRLTHVHQAWRWLSALDLVRGAIGRQRLVVRNVHARACDDTVLAFSCFLRIVLCRPTTGEVRVW